MAYRLRDKLSDGEATRSDIVCSLAVIVDKNVDRSTSDQLSASARLVHQTHGSRRIIGWPFSPFSCQNLRPRGIISSTSLASVAFSDVLTMFALTCKRVSYCAHQAVSTGLRA